MKESLRMVGRFLLWVVKLLLVIAAIAAAFAVLAALVEFQSGEYKSVPAAAVSAWILIIGLGVVLGVAFFAVRWAVSLLVTPPGTWSLFGDSAASRVIGLGVVALILPRAVVSLITVPVQVLLQLFGDLAGGIRRLILPTVVVPGSDHSVPPDQITLSLVQLLQGTVGEIGKALSLLFEQIPVYDVVLALALWVVVGQLLSAPAGATPGSQVAGPVRLIAHFQKLTDKQRRYLWIGLVFFAGIYLSIAAIVAIPWLQEDKPSQNLTRERLESALLTLVPKVDSAVSDPATPTTPPADALAQLESAITQATKQLEMNPINESQQRSQVLMKLAIEETRDDMDFARRVRDELNEQSKYLRDQVNLRRSQVVNEALNAFDTEMLSPMSTQERAFFFRDIQRSVQGQVADMQRMLQDCASAESIAEMQIESFARNSITALSGPDMSVTVFKPRASMLRALTTRGCSATYLNPVQYTTPDPGATWGPFAVVAQWLLRTKSHALALITGMLGFGLLGAAIATFVRPPDTSGTTTPAGDAATVMIRGLSAAIVVFLAVKGGLAIVATSEAEPNAYVLFFTCLVGAVFSEGVWNWAKTKLDGFLVNDGGIGAKPRAGSAPDPNPGSDQAGATPIGTAPAPPLAPASPQTNGES